MEILVALGFAAAVVLLADRLLLALERRGHVNWRRTGRRPVAGDGELSEFSELPRGLDRLLEDSR
ncbi:hypothetical protein J5X84_38805 [Streptosporangiaceae bacterium NEAU-GS5]|nr:hypothetical protein [Streptosporangiaceae bacterium NEAU-GS5]